MITLKKFFLISLVVPLFCSCGGGGSERQEAVVAQPPPLQVAKAYIQTDVPLFWTLQQAGSSLGSFYGQKASTGDPLKVEGAFFQKSIEADPYSSATFDSIGRIGSVRLESGASLVFSYPEPGKFVVSFTAGDGTVINLPARPYQEPKLSSVAPARAEIKSALHADIQLVNADFKATITLNGKPAPNTAVNTRVTYTTSSSGFNLPMTEVSPGTYLGHFFYPQDPGDAQTFNNKCRSTATFVADTCKWAAPVAAAMTGGGCIALSALAATTLGPGAIAVLASCESAMVDIIALCGIQEKYKPGEFCGLIAELIKFEIGGGTDITVKATLLGVPASATQHLDNSSSVEFTIPYTGSLAISPIAPLEVHNQSKAIARSILNGVEVKASTALTWTSESAAVASIDSSGLITAIAAGNTKINSTEQLSGLTSDTLMQVTDVYLKTLPPAGSIPYGVVVYVNDGGCPLGNLKEVTGGNQQLNIPRNIVCVPFPQRAS